MRPLRATPVSTADLLAAAHAARSRAYAPYSRFTVGAALLCDDGTVVAAANVENASYGLSMCAERSAVFAAVAGGRRGFSHVAVAGPDGTPITPCGACRQVLAEFGLDLIVVREGRDDIRLGDLLPDAFTPEHLDAAR